MELSFLEGWVRAARLYASEVLPWFAQALYAAPFVISPTLPYPAAIDREGRVYFGLGYLQALHQEVQTSQISPQEALQQLAFLWYHEIAHWLREHAGRAQALSANPSLWNIAADLEINDAAMAGLSFPRLHNKLIGVYPSQLNLPEGQIAEWYYEQLERPSPDLPSSAVSLIARVKEASQKAPSPLQGASEDAGNSVLPDEGSGVHACPRPWEKERGENLPPGLSETERKSLQQAVARAIKDTPPGYIPAGWKRWAETLLKPQITWSELLRRRINTQLSQSFGQKLDYSFRRPHRRSALYKPLYLPSLQSPPLPRIACVIDTSGSIWDSQLRQALSEVWAILSTIQVPLTIIPCDSRAYQAVQLTSKAQWPILRDHLRGGGGTDMRVGLEAARSLKPKPTLILIFTDGFTPYPDAPPKDVDVLWIVWKSSGAPGSPPLPPMPPWQRNQVLLVSVASSA